MITVAVPPGGAVTVVVVAYDWDQYSVVVTVGLGGSNDNGISASRWTSHSVVVAYD